MLFDVDVSYIKKFAREVGIGKRDIIIRQVHLGPNVVTYVSAKSDDGIQFVRDLSDLVPVIDVADYADEDEERDENSDEDSDDDE